MRVLVCLLLLAGAGYWGWSHFNVVTYPPGVRVSALPNQLPVNKAPWMKGEYRISPLASFSLDAKLLSRKRYSDRGAEIAPIDLALGWRALSDQGVVDQLRISQVMRFWQWRTRGNTWPAPRAEIESGGSNMHVIPATDAVKDAVMAFKRGEIVYLEGYLVRVDGPNGFQWSSSLSRSDTGNGACELFWVVRAAPSSR